MKVIKSTSRTFEDNILDYYDFDRLSSFNDIKTLIAALEKIKFELKSIYVSEFGDYDSGTLKCSYSKENIDNILTDFKDKQIDLFKLIGSVDDYRLVATIFPDINRLELEYSPESKAQLKDMLSNLDNNKTDSRTDTYDPYIK